MIKHAWTGVALIGLGLGLAGCGEKPQGLGGVKHDQAPHTGVGKSQYAQSGWTPGDRTAWEQHLKARAHHGQNDYSRASGQ